MTTHTRKLAAGILGGIIEAGLDLPDVEARLQWDRGELLDMLMNHRTISGSDVAALMRALDGTPAHDVIERAWNEAYPPGVEVELARVSALERAVTEELGVRVQRVGWHRFNLALDADEVQTIEARLNGSGAWTIDELVRVCDVLSQLGDPVEAWEVCRDATHRLQAAPMD